MLRPPKGRPQRSLMAVTYPQPPVWYRATFALCSSSVRPNTCEPSQAASLATKYIQSPSSGASTASSEAMPGLQMGPGGRPPRV